MYGEFGSQHLGRSDRKPGWGRAVPWLQCWQLPQGRVNPNAIMLLKGLNYPTDNLKSKDWAEFAEPDAPDLDFIITVCDHAANEMCPIWPGKPISAHWGLPDPASVEGTPTEIAAAFAETYRILNDRIEILVNLPLRSFNKLSLLAQLGEIADDRGRSL